MRPTLTLRQFFLLHADWPTDSQLRIITNAALRSECHSFAYLYCCGIEDSKLATLEQCRSSFLWWSPGLSFTCSLLWRTFHAQFTDQSDARTRITRRKDGTEYDTTPLTVYISLLYTTTTFTVMADCLHIFSTRVRQISKTSTQKTPTTTSKLLSTLPKTLANRVSEQCHRLIESSYRKL